MVSSILLCFSWRINFAFTEEVRSVSSHSVHLMPPQWHSKTSCSPFRITYTTESMLFCLIKYGCLWREPLWLLRGVSRICGADLGHTADLSFVNAGRKCGADLLSICMRGRIYTANPMRVAQKCLYLFHLQPGLNYAVLLTTEEEFWCGADRNIQIYVFMILWSGLHLCSNWTADPLRDTALPRNTRL